MKATQREFRCPVPDPKDRKRSSWEVRFKPGASGHIIDKHVKNLAEPGQEILPLDYYERLRSLPAAARNDDDHCGLKLLLLALAHQSCKRPQVVIFRERVLIPGITASAPFPVTCAVLVCHCGLSIAVRQDPSTEPSPHKIATAFFRDDILSRARGTPRWTKVCAELIREFCPTGDGGRVLYPEAEVTRVVVDEARADRELERSNIEFVTMYNWNFQTIDRQCIHRFSYPEWNPGPLPDVFCDRAD